MSENIYNDNLSVCPIVYSLNIVSKKWMLPIICELNKTKTLRYSELKRQINGVTNMALTQALKDLVERGLVERRQFNEVPPHTEYSLTSKGKSLLPALYSLAHWGLEQMEHSGIKCLCSNNCYGAYYDYVPVYRETEVLDYPETYNKRYLDSIARINMELEEENEDFITKISCFLLSMLTILTEDGEDATRWAMTYYFRADTPNILRNERPQYKILCELLTKGQEKGVITKALAPDYLAEELSKVITGMIGEWSMAKCSYDIVEYNRPMIEWLCSKLS